MQLKNSSLHFLGERNLHFHLFYRKSKSSLLRKTSSLYSFSARKICCTKQQHYELHGNQNQNNFPRYREIFLSHKHILKMILFQISFYLDIVRGAFQTHSMTCLITHFIYLFLFFSFMYYLGFSFSHALRKILSVSYIYSQV